MSHKYLLTFASRKVRDEKFVMKYGKKEAPLNPFLLSGYVSPEYFCDRENETAKLISALQNGRNVALISPRRMGKTGLIRHVFQKIEHENIARCYYVDLYQTTSLAELVEKLGIAVMGTLDSTEDEILKTIKSFFKSLHPLVSIDPMTGEPTFSINVEPEFAEQSLSEILSYMENAEQNCYVAFDEFQVIADYEDKRVEALLRAHIQHLSNVHFVFSGSQRHVLENMFTSVKRPFYQSCQIMHLGDISQETYYMFASNKLLAHEQDLKKEAFEYIYNRLHGHTWYIQMTLNRLYESCVGVIDEEQAKSILQAIIEDNEVTYYTFVKLISPAQAKLLKAIAKEGTIKEIQSNSFIKNHKLNAASTVKSAANVLMQKELLLEDNGEYSVYDRFFALWLSK